MKPKLCYLKPLALALVSLLLGAGIASAADDLKLRAGISFTQDLDSGFPIEGTNLADVALTPGKPIIVFFGASGDLNTNRQAKRFVDLYKKTPPQTVKFIVIDVDHPPNDDAKGLIKTYYKGYIPTQVVFDKSAKQIWTQTGEVETSLIKAQLEKQ